MVEEGDPEDPADPAQPGPSASTLPSPGVPDAPSHASADSFLRAAAHIPELGPTEAQGLAARDVRAQARGDLVAGAVIAKRYRLERELGRGGMGVVWEATHQVTRRRVAMKFVIGPADVRADLRRRFLREARAASAAQHPNVVDVLDVFELDDGTPVMVMEMLSGETLRERLSRERTLTLEATASILVPVVAAVGTAHALGIVHRDLKPENIFLLAGREPGENVKVLDFGVAKLLTTDGEGSETDSLTGTGLAVGTPCYMAPEQTTGEKDIDARADIWAIGVIAYECLAGVRPVEGSGIGQVVMKLMSEGIQPLGQRVSDLPPGASALVMRMLERDRRDRPKDLVEVQGSLAAFTAVKPRPFDTPAVGARRVDDAAPRPAPTPVVDTQSPQAIPGGVPRDRSGTRRSAIAGLAAAATLVATVVTWRTITRPPPAQDKHVESAATAASLATAPAFAPAPAPALASASAPPNPPLLSPGPKALPKAAPALSSRPDAASSLPSSSAPQASPSSGPHGLAQKPPF